MTGVTDPGSNCRCYLGLNHVLKAAISCQISLPFAHLEPRKFSNR
jgi:hypothetical protein